MRNWTSEDAVLVSVMLIDSHAVSVVRFDKDRFLYGVLEHPDGVLCLYGRNKTDLRRSFKLAMKARGAETGADTAVAQWTYQIYCALVAAIVVAKFVSPDKSALIIGFSAACLLIAHIFNLYVRDRGDLRAQC